MPKAKYHVEFKFTRNLAGIITTMSEPREFVASGEREYNEIVVTYMMERIRSLGNGWKAEFFEIEPWEYRALTNVQ